MAGPAHRSRADRPAPAEAPEYDVELAPTRVTLVPRAPAVPAEPRSERSGRAALPLAADEAVAAEKPRDSAGIRRRWSRPDLSFLGLIPFLGYVLLFLLVPTAVLLYGAFRRTDPVTKVSAFTWSNLSQSLRGPYLTALENSLQLALVTSLLSAGLGLVLARAIATSRSVTVKQLVSTGAAVLANFGGILLAFLFVAVLGSAGVLTTQLDEHLGISLQDDLGFSLFSLRGVELVYLYFLIPLMVLIMTPALEGLKPQWLEAAQNLGASRWQYWRHVAAPALAPTFFGATVLLFCSSLSAFATASALTNGSLPITTLQIDTLLSGNVITDGDALAAALAFNLIVIVVPLTLLYQFLQRRTSRWLQ